MKILFITDNFPPEYNAPATRTYEHCREWVKAGAEITVLTCAPNFPNGEVFKGYKNTLRKEEWIDQIRVIRVWTYITKNEGFLKRILDYFSFGFSSFLAGLFVRTDIIIATSPQIFSAVSGRILSFCKRRPWIMEVRDLWPESIVAVGAMTSNSFGYRMLEKMEVGLYRSADKIVLVTDSFKANLIQRGISPDKMVVIKNGVDLNSFYPRPKDETLSAQLLLKDKFVIGYLGTHGMAHGLDFILRSIKKIDDEGIHFLFIGDGAEKLHLKAWKEELHLRNVTLLDAIPKEKVAQYLSMVDVALVNLRKSLTFTTVIPSKIFESAAMGIPLLLGVDGEVRSLIEAYDAGLYFEPENEKQFIDAVESIRIPSNLERYKAGAQNLASAFDRKFLAGEMYKEIEKMLIEKR
jgi:glycosyltransferase involved in cell wall biosynthesis